MATKEQIKKQVDKLPDEWLDRIYTWLKSITKVKDKKKNTSLTPRDFKGKFDNRDLRKEAYE